MPGETKDSALKALQGQEPSLGNQVGGAMASAVAGAIMGYASVATGKDFLSVLPQRQAQIRQERRERTAALNKLGIAMNDGGEDAEKFIAEALGNPEDLVGAFQGLDAESADEIYKLWLSDRSRKAATKDDSVKLYNRLQPEAEARNIAVENFDPNSPEDVQRLAGTIEAHDYQRAKGKEAQGEAFGAIDTLLDTYVSNPHAPGFTDDLHKALGKVNGDERTADYIRQKLAAIDGAKRADTTSLLNKAITGGDWRLVESLWATDDGKRQLQAAGISSAIGSGSALNKTWQALQLLVDERADLPESLQAVAGRVDPDMSLSDAFDAEGPKLLQSLSGIQPGQLDAAVARHQATTNMLPGLVTEAGRFFEAAGAGDVSADDFDLVETPDGIAPQLNPEAASRLEDAYFKRLNGAQSEFELDSVLQSASTDLFLSKGAVAKLKEFAGGRTFVQPAVEGMGLISQRDADRVQGQVETWIRNVEGDLPAGDFPINAAYWSATNDTAWNSKVTTGMEQAALEAEANAAAVVRLETATPAQIAAAELNAKRHREAIDGAEVRGLARQSVRGVVDVAFRGSESDLEELVASQVGRQAQSAQGDPGIAGLEVFRQKSLAAAEDESAYEFFEAFHELWGANSKAVADRITESSRDGSSVVTALGDLPDTWRTRVDDTEQAINALVFRPGLIDPDTSKEVRARDISDKGIFTRTAEGLGGLMFGPEIAFNQMLKGDQAAGNKELLQMFGIPVPSNNKLAFNIGGQETTLSISAMSPRDLAAVIVTYHGS